MAEIPFPTIKLNQFDIEPTAESIIQHRSPFTGSTQIHSRGIMLMRGVVGWGQKNIGDSLPKIREIEAFLTRCYGGVNTFKIPIPYDQKDRFDSSNSLTISAATSDLFETQFTATAGILLGDWVNFGDRLHKIVSVSGTTYRVTPAIADTTEKLVWHSPYLNARLVQTSVVLPATATWRGPWEISVEEVT